MRALKNLNVPHWSNKMKKRILGLLAIIALVIGVAGTLIACGEEKADYSVTVLSPSDDPIADVEVSWMSGSKEAGKATTNEDGKATASLPLGTYTVALSNYGEGYSYTSASVSATMRNVTLELSVTKLAYSVTVTDKTGAPAQGVLVTWTGAKGEPAGTATTNASGKASKELAYGSYTVTLSNLPSGNTYDGAKTVTGRTPSASFALRNSLGDATYTVSVRSEGGLIFKNQAVLVYNGSTPFNAGSTNENGVFTFTAEPKNYTVQVSLVPDGYSYEPAALSASVFSAEIVLRSKVIDAAPPAKTNYVIGDIIHN